MDDNSTGVPKKKDLESYELSGKVMLFSVVTLIAFLLFILCFHFYVRFLSRRIRHRNSDETTHTHRHHFRPLSFCRRGLEPNLLKSIPTFSYSAAAHPKGLDCAVCLSDFEEGETGRVLPDCRHCFHVLCIDAWFKSHSNCPLCRAPVKPTPKDSSGEVAITIGKFSSSDHVSGSDPPSVECGCSATAGVLVPVECRRKSLGLVAEPPGWIGPRRESESGQGEGGSRSGDPENGGFSR